MWRVSRNAPEAFMAQHARSGRTFRTLTPFGMIYSTIEPAHLGVALEQYAAKLDKGDFAKALEPIWGQQTIQITDGADWERHRRACMPGFASALKTFDEAVERHLPEFEKSLETSSSLGEPAPLYFICRWFLFSILCDMFVGELDKEARLVLDAALRSATDGAARRMLRVVAIPLAFDKAYRIAAEQVRVLLSRLLSDGRKTPGGALVQRLLSVSDGDGRISFEEAINNLAVFMLAVYEFPSMGWCLVHLGGDRPARDWVRADLGTTRLNASCFESLRLFTPSPMLGRVAREDLDFGSWRLPAGRKLILPVIALHRDAEIWPDPDRYFPQRFVKSPLPYTFLPFGAGPRGCPGQNLAMRLKRFVLNYLLKRYDFELCDDQERFPYDCLKSYPNDGALCRLTRI